MEAVYKAIEDLRKALRDLDAGLAEPKLEIFPTLAPLLQEIRSLLRTIDLNHLTSFPVRTLGCLAPKIGEATKSITAFMVPSFPVEEQYPRGVGTVRPEAHVRNQNNIDCWRVKLESAHADLLDIIGPIVAQQQIRVARISGAVPVQVNRELSIPDPGSNVVVWRYMPLRNLLKSEANGGIWMSSLKTLAAWSKRGIVDTHEGEVPPILQRLKAEYASVVATDADAINAFMNKYGWDASDFERLGRILSDLMSETDKTFVSSWCKKRNESSTMWHLYGDQGRGVALKTTIEKLLKQSWGVPLELTGKFGRNRLSRPILREVKYFRFDESDEPPSLDDLHLPFLKRDQFDDEHEIRLVGLTSSPLASSGVTLICNLVDLVDEIVVGPHGDFEATAREIGRRAFDISDIPIRRSSIGPT